MELVASDDAHLAILVVHVQFAGEILFAQLDGQLGPNVRRVFLWLGFDAAREGHFEAMD